MRHRNRRDRQRGEDILLAVAVGLVAIIIAGAYGYIILATGGV